MAMCIVIWLSVLRPGIPNIRFKFFVKANVTKTTVNLDGIELGDETGDIAILAETIDMMLY